MKDREAWHTPFFWLWWLAKVSFLNTCSSNCIPVSADVNLGAMAQLQWGGRGRNGNSCIFWDKILTYPFNESLVEQSCDAFIIWWRHWSHTCVLSASFPHLSNLKPFQGYRMHGKWQRCCLAAWAAAMSCSWQWSSQLDPFPASSLSRAACSVPVASLPRVGFWALSCKLVLPRFV